MIAELELPLFTSAPKASARNVEWFVNLLRGRGWVLARDLLVEVGQPVTDGNKRFLRDLANQSEGKIGSGQKGYKLVEEMTAEEFAHAENWLASQEAEMKRRRIEMQRVFYAKTNRSPQ
jgi:hypothetical protein